MFTLEDIQGLTVETITTGTIQFIDFDFPIEGFITYYKNSDIVTICEGGSVSGIPVTTLYVGKRNDKNEIVLIGTFDY